MLLTPSREFPPKKDRTTPIVSTGEAADPVSSHVLTGRYGLLIIEALKIRRHEFQPMPPPPSKCTTVVSTPWLTLYHIHHNYVFLQVLVLPLSSHEPPPPTVIGLDHCIKHIQEPYPPPPPAKPSKRIQLVLQVQEENQLMTTRNYWLV